MTEDQAQQAANWAIRMQRPLSSLEQQALDKWLAQDAKNNQFLAKAQATWQLLGQLPNAQKQPLAPVKSAAKYTTKRWFAVAASVFFALSLAFTLLWQDPALPANTFASAQGQIQTISTEDGSQIELDSQSRVELAFDSQQRQVKLLAGRAYFTVAAGDKRPFIVTTTQGSVTALGTMFSVAYTEQGVVNVAVYEHSVLVQTQAGQQATLQERYALNYAEQISHAYALNELDSADWRHKRLIFTDQPLVQVLHTLNKYRSKPIYLLTDQAKHLPISGVMHIDDLDPSIAALAKHSQLSLVETPLATLLY